MQQVADGVFADSTSARGPSHFVICQQIAAVITGLDSLPAGLDLLPEGAPMRRQARCNSLTLVEQCLKRHQVPGGTDVGRFRIEPDERDR